MKIHKAINLEDIRQLAKNRLPKVAFDFIDGGVDDERGLARNRQAFDQFHLIGYRRNLIDKVGERKVMELEQQHRLIKKWSRTELNEIINQYGETK